MISTTKRVEFMNIELRAVAKKHIHILGDIPIYVNHNSADVWLNKEIFELDKHGEMSFVSGAVPDSFNRDGQVWNNCLYNWETHKLNNYEYWTNKLNKTLDLYDYLRIDHFVGFFKYWVIKSIADGQFLL